MTKVSEGGQKKASACTEKKKRQRKQQEGRQDKEEECSCKDASVALRQRSPCSPRGCPMLSHPICLTTPLPALLYLRLLELVNPLVQAQKCSSHASLLPSICFFSFFVSWNTKPKFNKPSPSTFGEQGHYQHPPSPYLKMLFNTLKVAVQNVHLSWNVKWDIQLWYFVSCNLMHSLCWFYQQRLF